MSELRRLFALLCSVDLFDTDLVDGGTEPRHQTTSIEVEPSAGNVTVPVGK